MTYLPPPAIALNVLLHRLILESECVEDLEYLGGVGLALESVFSEYGVSGLGKEFFLWAGLKSDAAKGNVTLVRPSDLNYYGESLPTDFPEAF